MDNDGFRDEIIVGEGGDLWGFEFNGTPGVMYTNADSIWNQTEPSAGIHEIVVVDIDGDGTQEVIVGDAEW